MSESVRAAYDEWHRQHQVDPDVSSPWYQMVRSAVRPERDLRDRRVLEIGCGLGGFAVWLATQPATPQEVVAADFSPAAVEKAKSYAEARSVPGIRWAVSDIQSLAEYGAEFDTVFSCETIEHVPDPRLAVRQLARVLKPGGRMFLTTPNYFGPFGLYRIYSRLRGRPYTEGGQPICQPNTLFKTRAWVRDAGLQLERSSGVGHYVIVPGRSPIRIRAIDHLGMSKWVAHHTLVVGYKPGSCT